jgi:hypothetical protein
VSIAYIHQFMNVIWNSFVNVFSSRSNGLAVQGCMLLRLSSMQFVFVVIGHDLS